MTTTTTISESTKQDVKFAWEAPLRVSDRLTGDWIYGVDPESMDEIKSYWKTLDGGYSLMNVFAKILKSN